jgi:dTMP kinase
MKRKGFFITFEGIDGSGKTTQLKLTEKYLSEKGFDILTLREPGSTPVSERIRNILLNKKLDINPVSELMLYLAARAELVETTIAPAIRDGRIVLCDRFYDSTTAYQGYGRGIDIKLIKKLNCLAINDSKPDLTFVVDINYAASLKRRKKKSDRLESESKAFFNRVRNGFLEIARQEKSRVVVLNGGKSIDKIFDEVKSCLKKNLKIK